MKRKRFVLFIAAALISFSSLASAADQHEVSENSPSGHSRVQQVASDPFLAAKGKYAIGTTFFTWTDNNAEGNKYIGQIWYPATSCAGIRRSSYLPTEIYKTALAKQVPQIASLQSITTDAMIDAPLLGKNDHYPVLIYSPGLGLIRQAGTFFFEYLASRGFIVAAIDHPGSSFFTELEGGSLIPYNQAADYTSSNEKVSLTKARAGQLSCALNALIHLNDTPTSIFFKKMDVNNVGVFGHSIGGRSALRAASLDNRFKAAVNLDGSMEEEPPYTFTNQEFLIAQTDIEETIQDELAAGTTKPEEVANIKKTYAKYMDNLLNSPHAKKYLVYYKHTKHMNYTDWPLLFEHSDQVGSANATIVLLSISKLLDDFFNEAFYHPASSLKNKFPAYPYAELKKVKNNLDF